MYVPCFFWFCKFVGDSLPLVSLNNTTVQIKIKFKKLNECAYWESGTRFSKQPKLKASLLCQFIYVEQEERTRIINAKHEYLIETTQSETNYSIEPSNFVENNVLSQRFYFKNPCKEIIWTIRELTEINGSNANKELRWHVYTNKLIGEYPNHVYYKIKFNGRERQPKLQSEVYNLIIPYNSHTSIPDNGIYNYSFSLVPELLQPSGSANLSEIQHMDIDIQLNDTIIADIIANNRVFQWDTHTRHYNILRIMSGMSGLAFFS